MRYRVAPVANSWSGRPCSRRRARGHAVPVPQAFNTTDVMEGSLSSRGRRVASVMFPGLAHRVWLIAFCWILEVLWDGKKWHRSWQ